MNFYFFLGINNSGGNMIMTSSQISTMGGMGGGGLVVSSSGAINKPLSNAGGNMFAPGGHQQQQQHPQGVPQGIPNGPMMNRVAAASLHMQRAPTNALHLGTRLQGPTGAAGLCGPPGMAANAPYSSYQNSIPQTLPIGKYILQFLLYIEMNDI